MKIPKINRNSIKCTLAASSKFAKWYFQNISAWVLVKTSFQKAGHRTFVTTLTILRTGPNDQSLILYFPAKLFLSSIRFFFKKNENTIFNVFLKNCIKIDFGEPRKIKQDAARTALPCFFCGLSTCESVVQLHYLIIRRTFFQIHKPLPWPLNQNCTDHLLVVIYVMPVLHLPSFHASDRLFVQAHISELSNISNHPFIHLVRLIGGQSAQPFIWKLNPQNSEVRAYNIKELKD